MSDKDFLSVEEIAKRLGLKEETIRTYIREGSLSAYRFGNILRVRVDDFEKFVEARKIRRDEGK
ncbi:helix-turn-helix domain-containing protein [Ktedonobacter racemifer]|uniref:DNA binding domain protein, excisionase family n=1 Tax=Ktedonobacter racemifer DSM 44963 TaxID=485913 RepID=D6TPH9_KTERA|nr:helix-turn-helix domain-containing protein [Ktedonobacter racemifer]EFH85593.1 DNA binding domain protein, excisionase family [Ktedonobacter racemifer DSM 44963]